MIASEERDRDGLFRKKKSPYFYFKAPVVGEPGKYNDVSTKEASAAKAQLFKAKYLDNQRKGLLPNERVKWTLHQAVEKELEFRSLARRSTSRAPNRTSANHLLRLLGRDARLDRLASITVIENYQLKRMAERKKAKTINNEVSLLTAILTKAGLWDRVAANYKPLPVEIMGPGHALTPEEGQHLFEVAQTKDAWFTAFCVSLLGYSTGCRRGEIASLQLCDIDLQSPEAFIGIRRKNAKNDPSARRVSLIEHALWAVDKLLQRAELLGATEPEHYLLPANLSKHTRKHDALYGHRGFDPGRHQNSWDTAWDSLRHAAGLKTLRFHDLRHTFITHAMESNTNIDFVMAQVGHLSARMTRHYLHLSGRAPQQAANAAGAHNPGLSQILGNPKK